MTFKTMVGTVIIYRFATGEIDKTGVINHLSLKGKDNLYFMSINNGDPEMFLAIAENSIEKMQDLLNTCNVPYESIKSLDEIPKNYTSLGNKLLQPQR